MQPFIAIRQKDLAEAGGETRFLAGGTTLVDLMKLDVETPKRLLDLTAIDRPDLHDVTQIDDGVRIGALVTMAEAAEHELVSRNYPLVAQSLTSAASQQIRNMATLGGNLLQRTRCAYFRDRSYRQCNKREPGSGCSAREGINRQHAVLGTSDDCVATYPGDFAQALIAIDGQLELEGRDGKRRMSFADLHRPVSDGPHRETTLKDGEMIAAIILPPEDYRRSLYLKIRDRASYEFAAASAAVALVLDESRRVVQARIALGGVAYRPWRAREAEQSLAGAELTEARAAEAGDIAFRDAKPLAHNGFKITLGKETLIEALLRAQSLEL